MLMNYNTNHLFTGYIKELLASFNLPMVKVYTGEDESQILPDTIYLKDDKFVKYNKNNNTWKSVAISAGSVTSYSYNQYIPNFTTQFKIENNIYDRFTHEYLGEYLRFQRDYLGLNLMSMYNCFNDNVCNSLNIKISKEIKTETTKEIITVSEFNTSDPGYKIYMLPIKLFQEYTIAVDCNSGVEVCCGIYGAYEKKVTGLSDNIATFYQKLSNLTYKKFNTVKFKQGVLYSTNLPTTESEEFLKYVAKNEKNIKLFLKLPVNNSSSITILEGNYLTYNDCLADKSGRYTFNQTVINCERLQDLTDSHIKLTSPLQLLQFNSGKSYPMADRLVEYLTGQVITPLDQNSDNIKRLQTVIYTYLKSINAGNDIIKQIPMIPGVWADVYKLLVYTQLIKKLNSSVSDIADIYDLTGFIDRTAEKYYSAKIGDETTTLLSVDIYPEQTAVVNGGSNE